MRFVVNSHAHDDSVKLFVLDRLARGLEAAGHEVARDDWAHYERFDVALFLGSDPDLERAYAQNPQIRVVLVDPKQSKPEWIDASRRADVLLVSSVEQRDALLRLNRNTHISWVFPSLVPREREHVNREPLVIGYHGNRVHIETMAGAARPAIEALGRSRPVELWVFYDYEVLGRADLGLPDPSLVSTRHIRWTPSSWTVEDLSVWDRVDLGVVPNELPIRERPQALEAAAYREPRFFYETFDHLVRFKASSGPGRIYPFAQLGIPVVSDFIPSASQFVDHGRSGFVASSPHGWLEALTALADSPETRASFAAALRERFEGVVADEVDQLVSLCSAPSPGPPLVIPGVSTAEDDLARLGHYARARTPLVRRVAGAVRRAAAAVRRR